MTYYRNYPTTIHMQSNLAKAIPNWEHCLSTAFGVSKKCYGGGNNKLAGTG